MEQQQRNIGFFSLNRDGDFANVKILHKTTNTIEHADLHWITEGDKKRIVKCISNDCPLCQSSNQASHRIFIHLYDFADNKEKVWSRTDKILPQLKEIEDSWGDLSRCILRITRVGDNFPKYTISVLNPDLFQPVPQEIMQYIDTNVGFRCYSTRSKEEILEYINTGHLPERKKTEFRPKAGSVPSNYSNVGDKTNIKEEVSDIPFEVGGIDLAKGPDHSNIPNNKQNIDDPFSMFAPRKV